MKIIAKIKNRNNDNHAYPIPTIVAFGDSVTQGCFEVYDNGDGSIRVVYDMKNAYHAYLSSLINEIFPYAAVTVVNAGISGDSTEGGLKRLSRDVISKNPDLVIVSFGLNDCVVRGGEYADTYAENLRKMFTEIMKAGSEAIYMTPPMMCKSVRPEIEGEELRKIAADVAKAQNAGLLDLYCEKGIAVAKECGVTVCDLHKKWNDLAANGVDTDLLLSNYINHPTREMTNLTARTLFDTMIELK